jgi:hypothetical protein
LAGSEGFSCLPNELSASGVGGWEYNDEAVA